MTIITVTTIIAVITIVTIVIIFAVIVLVRFINHFCCYYDFQGLPSPPTTLEYTVTTHH